MLLLPALALLLAQDAPTPPPPAAEQPAPALPADASPEARATWQRLVASARTPDGDPAPITAFVLEADVLRREGAARNELKPRYAFLSPDLVRFSLSRTRETGRGQGVGRAAYWLRDGDEVHRLLDRTHAEDRRQIDDMLVLARNFVALTDPTRLRITSLRTLPLAPLRGPTTKLRKRAKELTWLHLASPDFALLREARGRPGASPPVYDVFLGLDPATSRPELVHLGRAASDGRPAGEPLLFELTDWRPVDGFQVPHRIFARRPLPAVPATRGRAFEKDPWQEIWVRTVALRPELTAADFEPR